MDVMLDILLLGSMVVRRDGREVTFSTESARGLFAYLLMNRERPFPRIQLATLFWPDHPEKEAFRNLRQMLLRLRRALGDSDQNDNPIILANRLTIQLNPAYPLTLDVAQLQDRLAAVARVQGNQAGLRQKMLLLEEATAPTPHAFAGTGLSRGQAVYRGCFLADVQGQSELFNEWQAREQEKWVLPILTAWEQLAELYAANGRYAEMADVARQQIELEPWREGAHQQLMQALWAQGKRTAAIAQYEIVRAILEAELGIEPRTAVTQLRDRILREETLPDIVDSTVGQPSVTTAPLYGREAELAQLHTLILGQNERLVTILGSGGVGKSRLAMAAGQAVMGYFPHGVWFVPLAGVHGADTAVDNPEQLTEIIALNIAQTIGLKLQGAALASEQLFAHLQSKELLLILDNLEHLQVGLDIIPAILAAAPAVALLCTSRQPLYFQAEYRLRLRGLPVPPQSPTAPQDEPTVWQQYAAMQLLAARLQRVGVVVQAGETETAVKLCQWVDGLPLALELLAACSDQTTLTETAVAIQQRYDALTTQMRDAEPRHRSLWAVFTYSWQLLSNAQRTLWAQMTVFRGSFDAKAVISICAASSADLQRLVDASLLQKVGADRYALHEMLRQFAAEKRPDVVTAVKQPHSDYYLNLVIQATPQLTSKEPDLALQQIQRELVDIHKGWETAVRQPQLFNTVYNGVNSLSGLTAVYGLLGLHREAVNTFQSGINICQQHPANADTQTSIGLIMMAQANFLVTLSQNERLISQMQALIDLGEQLENPQFIATGYLQWGDASRLQGAYQLAQTHLKQAAAIAQVNDLLQIKADSFRKLGILFYELGEYAEALSYYEQAYTAHSQINDWEGQISTLSNMGLAFSAQDDQSSALDYYQRALQLAVARKSVPGQGLLFNNLGLLYHRSGQIGQALHYYEQALHIHQQIENRRDEAAVLNNLADLYRFVGQYERALPLYQTALSINRDIGNRHFECGVLGNLALLSHHLGQPEQGMAYGRAGLALAQQIGASTYVGMCGQHLGRVLAGLERWEEATAVYQQALAVRRTLGETHFVMESLAGLAHIALASGRAEDARHLVDEIVAYLADRDLDGALEPFRVYLVCYRVLIADQDNRANPLLQMAYEQLQHQANKLDDAVMRDSFLHGMSDHREIVLLAV